MPGVVSMRKRYTDTRHPNLWIGPNIRFRKVYLPSPAGYDGPPIVHGVYETSDPDEQRIIETSASGYQLTVEPTEPDPEPDPETGPERFSRSKLAAMNKETLRAVAEGLGLEVPEGATNAAIVEAIWAAQGGDTAE